MGCHGFRRANLGALRWDWREHQRVVDPRRMPCLRLFFRNGYCFGQGHGRQ